MTAQLALALPADVAEPTEPEAGTIEAKVLGWLRHANYAWKRSGLVRLCTLPGQPVSDREVRRAVANLIDMGHPIVSSSRGGGGYRLAQEADDLAPAIADCKSRVRKLTSRAGALERAQRALLARTA